MLLSEGQISDYKGAALMLSAMPKAKQLLADKGSTPTGSAPPIAKRRITGLHSFQSQSQNRDTP